MPAGTTGNGRKMADFRRFGIRYTPRHRNFMGGGRHRVEPQREQSPVENPRTKKPQERPVF
jgi:hypothetical protein